MQRYLAVHASAAGSGGGASDGANAGLAIDLGLEQL